jgi:hypothetical protein
MLEAMGERFETQFRTPTGLPIKGVLQPLEDGKIYPDDYFYPRQILRVRPHMPVQPGAVLFDPQQRPWLLGELDTQPHYRSFQMYRCTKLVSWQRERSETDTLTGLSKSSGLAPVAPGSFWCLIETLPREAGSTNIKAKEETKRVVTGEAVQMGDIVDGMRVTKINVTHGIRVLELI